MSKLQNQMSNRSFSYKIWYYSETLITYFPPYNGDLTHIRNVNVIHTVLEKLQKSEFIIHVNSLLISYRICALFRQTDRNVIADYYESAVIVRE